VFRNKLDGSGNVVRNKAIIVAKGYNQEGTRPFPMTRLESICIMLTFASYLGIKIFQMDFKCAFLNGFLQEEVFVEQPLDFENPDFRNHVFKLQKALYGLKTSP